MSYLIEGCEECYKLPTYCVCGLSPNALETPGLYAGIGSRKTPPLEMSLMIQMGKALALRGWILRSGGADGADWAFDLGCGLVRGESEIFFATDAKNWALKEAVNYVPIGRPPFTTWRRRSQQFAARNMMQVLGRDQTQPVKFVLCYFPGKVFDGGGTGYAVRCALKHGIKVYNLKVAAVRNKVEDLIVHFRRAA